MNRPAPPGLSCPDTGNAPQRILIIRLSALGDVALSSHVLEPLRRAFPRAHIAWLVQPEFAGLLEGNPNLDEVLVVDRHRWSAWLRRGRLVRLAVAIARQVRRLRRERFDLALDLQGLWKSAVWARLSGAPVRIALGPREGSGVAATTAVQRPRQPEEFAGEYAQILTAIGIDKADPSPGVRPAFRDRKSADDRIAAAGLGKDFIALCPFTTRPQKHWFESQWQELAARLHAATGWPVVLLGGPADRAAADRMLADAGIPCTSLAGQTTVGEAAAVVGRARLVIGVDTGLTHIAAGQGRPTVALFGSTRPYRLAPDRPVRVLYRDLECAPCHRHPTCNGRHACMRSLAVNEVLEAADQVLGRPLSPTVDAAGATPAPAAAPGLP